MNVSFVLTSCGWAAEPMADQTNQTKKAAKRLRHISFAAEFLPATS